MNTRKLTTYALLAALAMILSFVESRIPAFFAVPGMKLGLTNIVVLTALYKLDAKSALFINIVRIIVVSVLFGNVMAFAFSMAGGFLSWAVMVLSKRSGKFGITGVSTLGGIFHNIGQILVAIIALNTYAISWYLPILWFSGIVSGFVIGLLGALILKHLPKEII